MGEAHAQMTMTCPACLEPAIATLRWPEADDPKADVPVVDLYACRNGCSVADDEILRLTASGP